jgi:hypothetical protein
MSLRSFLSCHNIIMWLSGSHQPCVWWMLTPFGCVPTNGVQASRVESDQTHKDAAETIWLTHTGYARECVPTSRVESRESCRVKSLDAACSLFVSLTLVIRADGCYFALEMYVEKFILLVKGHQAICDACHSEHRNRLHCQRLGKNCTGDGRG